jgi:hypothetical protein
MIAWEEEEIMAKKMVDQTDNNNMEDTEVTPSNAHPSLVLGNLGGTSTRTLRDLGEDRGNSTTKAEVHLTRSRTVQ